MSSRVSRRRPKRPIDAERRKRKDALWSFVFHAAGYRPSTIPAELHPMPLSCAMEEAAGWRDEHARERRARTLRRFDPDLHSGFDQAVDRKALRTHFLERKVHLQERMGADDASCRSLLQRVEEDYDDLDWEVCLPTTNKPSYDPERGSTELLSELLVNRELNIDLARVLDPRGWDACSDLFEDTFEVVERDGVYHEVPTRPEAFGKNWEGLLYELADAGPQAVENILNVRFTVTRICNPIPEWLASEQQKTEGRGEVASLHQRLAGVECGVPHAEGSKLPDACRSQTCRHDIDGVEVLYSLHDSLSYRIGGLVLPGTLRRNHGYFRVWRMKNRQTSISCLKKIRFGRVSRWSAGGTFDYGEILNYTAPTLLSLWVGDLEQIVPCCKERRPMPAELRGSGT